MRVSLTSAHGLHFASNFNSIERHTNRRNLNHMKSTLYMLPLIALTLALACSNDGDFKPADGGQTDPYTVVAKYPHDLGAFTQGLVFDDGYLIESTGRIGWSSLRRVEISTGEVIDILGLDDAYFGEGVAIVDDVIFQLTWQNHICFKYRLSNFESLGSVEYPGEGWGLTYIDPHLVMSNGSSTLKFIDPVDFSVVSEIQVTENGSPVRLLNELEYIAGKIYANIYQSDFIVIIDPADGRVLHRVYLAGLRELMNGSGYGVLNGIAYDATGDRLFVTGKNWPNLFEIKINR